MSTCQNHDNHYLSARQNALLFFITLALFAFVLTMSGVFDSLALNADAWHVLADSNVFIANMAAGFAIRMLLMNEERAKFLCLSFNTLTLGIAIIWVVFEAIERLTGDVPVAAGLGVAAVAAISAAVNELQLRIHHRSDGKDESGHKVTSLHIIQDRFINIGVAVSGVLIWVTGWNTIDPIVSLAIAIYLVVQTAKVLREEIARKKTARAP